MACARSGIPERLVGDHRMQELRYVMQLLHVLAIIAIIYIYIHTYSIAITVMIAIVGDHRMQDLGPFHCSRGN